MTKRRFFTRKTYKDTDNKKTLKRSTRISELTMAENVTFKIYASLSELKSCVKNNQFLSDKLRLYSDLGKQVTIAIVAYSEEKPLGFIYAYNDKNPGGFYIHYLTVDPDHQRKGIARQLEKSVELVRQGKSIFQIKKCKIC